MSWPKRNRLKPPNFPRRFFLVISVAVYSAVFNWSYITRIAPEFSYYGYSYHPTDVLQMALAWLLAILPAFWMPISFGRPSQFLYWMLYLLVVIPVCFVPLYVLSSGYNPVLLWAALIVACFAGMGLIYRLPLNVLPRIMVPRRMFWYAIVVLTVVLYSTVIAVTGFTISNPLTVLQDVYSPRFEFRDIVQDNGRLVAYAVSWLGYVINPFFMVTNSPSKRPALFLVGLLGQLFLFTLTGSKSVFLSIFVLGAIFFVAKASSRLGYVLSWGLAGMILGCAAVDLLTNTTFMTSVFVRRLIATNGLLTGYYFDFFLRNPYYLLAHSVLRGITTSRYVLAPPNTIGLYYFGTSALSANANFWADSFANFGFAGLPVFSLFLAAIMHLIDRVTIDLPPRIVLPLLALPAFSLISSALLTDLLTHGILLLMVILYVMPGPAPETTDAPEQPPVTAAAGRRLTDEVG